MTYYRQYRPQTLAEILGQENVTSTLSQAYKNDQLSHAYLFTGPRGLGKTSAARILAKIVNCERWGTKDELPCNKCQSCLAITDGSSLDYLEIDAASNRGIDDIRSLRENIKLAPSSDRKKVYVIDEVHMLTAEAFNALLKTLEEPPAHVLFILATTEAHKIPATILSRVQRLDFQPAKSEDLLQALQNVVEKEKLEAETEALVLIAKRAEGSFRDGLKLLDQLASSKQKITVQRVEDSFKSGKFSDALSLLEAVVQRNSQLALNLINQQLEQGVQLKEFTYELLNILRMVLLMKYGAKLMDDLGSDQAIQIKSLVEKFNHTQLVSLINGLHGALEKMKTTSIVALPLEVAVIEACGQNTQEVRSVTEQPNIAEASKTPLISAKTKEKLEEAKIDGQILEVTTRDDSEDLAKLLDKWTYILETVKPYNYSLEALLRQVKVASCDSGLVILEVPYSFHQRILEAPKSRDLLESVISDVLGKESKVSCVLGERPVRIEEIANVEVAADDEIISVAAAIFNSEPVT